MKKLATFGFIFLVLGCSRGYQDFAGNCSRELVSDYSSVLATYGPSDQLSRAKQLMGIYPDVDCTAEQKRTSDLGWSEVRIDVKKEMSELIAKLEKGVTPLRTYSQFRAKYSDLSRSELGNPSGTQKTNQIKKNKL